MLNITQIDTVCPVCGRSGFSKKILKISQVPVHCNLLWDEKEKALLTPRGDIDLTFCEFCGHMYNSAFDPDLMQYEKEYENSLHYSSVFKEYADYLTEKIIDEYDIRRKKILEIGCGQGDFLKQICRVGNNQGMGFDPTYVADGKELPENVEIIRDYFSDRYSVKNIDLVLSRHVLEHIQYPAKFLTEIKTLIEENNPIVYFEVPNAMYTLQDLGIWDLIYEHCSFFSLSSLVYLFKSTGFKVLEARAEFGNQFLGIFTQPTVGNAFCAENEHSFDSRLILEAKNFSDQFSKKVIRANRNLSNLIRRRLKMVIWGAGSKGVTFANYFKTQEFIPYVVDINPKKQGKFITGTGQKIISPEELISYQPDVIIILNPLYEDEIRKITSGLGLSPEISIY